MLARTGHMCFGVCTGPLGARQQLSAPDARKHERARNKKINNVMYASFMLMRRLFTFLGCRRR